MPINISDFLQRLEGVVRASGGWMAKCPCHNDKKASLCISEGEKGIVLKCMAGCETRDIVERLGLTMGDLFYDGKQGTTLPAAREKGEKRKKPAAPLAVGQTYYNSKTQQNEEITAEYPYRNGLGTVVLKVFRTAEKSFPVQYVQNGEWFYGRGPYGNLLFNVPGIRKAIAEKRLIYVVEGEKDAVNMAALGYTATTNLGGANKWQPQMGDELKGADVVLIPDNDAPGRKSVQRIAEGLRGIAERVRVIDLVKACPDLPEKGDITDFFHILGKSRGMEALQKLVEGAEIRATDVGADAMLYAQVDGYAVIDHCLYSTRGRGMRKLCNFVPVPEEEVILDDGITTSMVWHIGGYGDQGQQLRSLVVSSDDFESMRWVLRGWGMMANIEPGTGTRDMLRSAIQAAGAALVKRRTVYTHTGWRRIPGGGWTFLHAGGAVGSELSVSLENMGAGDYDLCGAVAGELAGMDAEERARQALRASLRLIGAALPRITVPLLAFMYLAPLREFLKQAGCEPAFLLFIRGRHQSGKTAISSLFLCHYGRTFSNMHVPASFQGTLNSVRQLASTLKDLPLLVDDYKPESTQAGKRAQDQIIMHLCRAFGDGADRSRMRADGKMQKAQPPRASGIMTGEDLPSGDLESTIGRMYVIDCSRGDIHLDAEMETLQQMAMDGVFTEAMLAYLRWVAARAEGLPERLQARFRALRSEEAETSQENKRMAGAIAHLRLGLEMMLACMADLGALDGDAARALLQTYVSEVRANAAGQLASMRESQPARAFVNALSELLRSGENRVKTVTAGAASDKGMPMDALGYRDSENYYLFPDQTYRAVQVLYKDQGMLLPLGKNMLYRALCEEGLALYGENKRATKVVNRMNGQIKGRFLVMPRRVIEGLDGQPEEEKAQFVQVDMDMDDPWKGAQ